MAKSKKPDKGIATVPTVDSLGRKGNFQIEEAVRDALQRRDWSGPQHNDSSNPNTMTTPELERVRFSGFRINRLISRVELWILGQVKVHRRLQDVEKNPALLGTMHEEAFKTIGTIVIPGDPPH